MKFYNKKSLPIRVKFHHFSGGSICFTSFFIGCHENRESVFLQWFSVKKVEYSFVIARTNRVRTWQSMHLYQCFFLLHHGFIWIFYRPYSRSNDGFKTTMVFYTFNIIPSKETPLKSRTWDEIPEWNPNFIHRNHRVGFTEDSFQLLAAVMLSAQMTIQWVNSDQSHFLKS